MMAVAVHANDERMTYSHSGLPISSTSPFIQHDHDILPGDSSVGTHFPLINGHSFTPQPSPELQKPGFEKILESTEPANNGESVKSSAQWTMAKNKIVTAPYDYLLSNPGKDIRKQVLLAFNDWLHVNEESCEIINRVISMLHNASLLIDDIQDNSRLRRGAPSAHIIFGIAQTINSANYIYFQAQQELFQLKQWPVALEIYNEELLNLHRGQGMELYWRDSLTVPTEEEYLEMISNKTGGLFRLALRLMQAVSKSDCNILPLVEVVGLIFQIQDDYKNLSSNQMAAAKGYCEDLTEGKFSFPVIHAIRNSECGNCEMINILKSRTEDNAVKARAVFYMRQVTESFDYTKGFLRELHNQALSLMDALGPRNCSLEAILNRLVTD